METNLDALRNRVLTFCQERGYGLAPEAEQVLAKIARRKDLYGDYFCPSQAERNSDTVCVCRRTRHGLVDAQGACFCNLIRARPTSR